MIYLASPYSHPDPAVRQARFDAACRAAAELIHAGHVVISPVVHGHPIAALGLPTDWPFWERFNCALMERCDRLVVLALDGWQESIGVQAEIALAKERSLSIEFVAPELCATTPTLARVGEG